jgi:GMP synthase (glutamine-hydrolysing)
VKILIVDSSPQASQAAAAAYGGRPHGENYRLGLQSQTDTPLDCFILHAADGDTLPQGMAVSDFHGIAWTGSPMSAYDTSPLVSRQIDFARFAFQSGVPCFGSCWGLQVMSTALGGKVRLNPKGMEIGIARQITVNAAGRTHPMYNGKAPVFDAACVHQDEVFELPQGAELLSGNAVSDVQALSVDDGARSFWGVQYHPEYDLRQLSALLRRSAGRLVREGLARTLEEAEAVGADLRALHDDPSRKDLAWRYDIGPDITDPARHRREFANWLRVKVAPRVG